MAIVCFVLAFFLVIATVLWLYREGKAGLLFGLGGAAFLGQWGWNLWHSDLSEQNRWLK